jgi:hypothetical protein
MENDNISNIYTQDYSYHRKTPFVINTPNLRFLVTIASYLENLFKLKWLVEAATELKHIYEAHLRGDDFLMHPSLIDTLLSLNILEEREGK